LWYQEDQPGYLAGMVAASVSKTGEIGAIGGITLCAPCIRYIQGYALGAKAVNPNVKVRVAWVTESDFVKAFNDPDGGKNFAQQFMAQYPQVDVLFQVAGKTGNGVLDAACDANKLAIGVDVDQALSYPSAAKCIVTSAEKKLALSVAAVIQEIAAGTAKGGEDLWDAKRDGIGISPFHDFDSQISSDLKTKLDNALKQMKDGTLKTCPDNCGAVPAPQIGD
jgi:basic membrane protein A